MDPRLEIARQERREHEARRIVSLGLQHGRRDLADTAILRGTPLRVFESELLAEIAAIERPAGFIGMTRKEVAQWSLSRYLEEPLAHRDSLERECSRAVAESMGVSDGTRPGVLYVPKEIQQRDLSAGIGSAGGYLVESRNVSFTDALYAASVSKRLGATVISGLKATSHVPRIAESATASWLADETSEVTETQQSIGDLALTPKTVGAYVELSRLIVGQAVPSVEQLIFTDLGRVLAEAVDLGAIAGSGAAGQPLGLLSTDGLGAFTGGSLDLAALTNAQVDVAEANAILDEAALGYATTPAVAGLLKSRQRFTGSSTALWEGSVHSGVVEGAQAMSSTSIPAATAIYGDWSSMILAEWGALRLATNPVANFQAGIIGIRALWTVDIGVRHTSSFSVATSIT